MAMDGTAEAVRRAMLGRRSAGAWGDAPVPREVVARLIEAATWAPNHHLSQPWRFHVVSGAAREAMAEAVGRELDEGEARSVRAKLLRSPLFIVVSQAREGAAAADEERDLEDYAAVACATQNLLLAAHAEGLAAKWSTGKLATYPAAKAYLGIPERDRIVAYVYLGPPAEGVPTPTSEREAPRIIWHE